MAEAPGRTAIFVLAVLQFDFRGYWLAPVNWALVCASETSTCVSDKKQPFQEILDVARAGI